MGKKACLKVACRMSRFVACPTNVNGGNYPHGEKSILKKNPSPSELEKGAMKKKVVPGIGFGPMTRGL